MIEKIQFPRGSTLNFVVQVDSRIPDNLFSDWSVSASMYKQGSYAKTAKIADINAFWVNDTFTMVGLYHNATNKWPVVNAELIITFESSKGEVVKSAPVPFRIY